MRKSSLFIPVVCALLLLASPSYGQFHLSIAPVLGMNFNLHTGSDLQSTGSGVGLVFGGQAIMSFTPMIGMVSGLTFYDNRSGSFTQSYPSKKYNNATDNVDQSNSIAYLQIEDLFLLRLPKIGLFFVAGPVIGFNIEGSYENTVKSVDNNNPDNTATAKSKGSIKDMLVRFEIKLGSGYDFKIGKNISLFPQITFGFGLTKVVSDVSYRIMTFQLVVGAKFDIL